MTTMKRLTILLCAAVLLASCSQNPTARIRATVEGAPDSSIVLQKLNYNRLVAVDTFRTDAAGHFNCKVKLTGNEPYFYYLYAGGNPVASMILLPGDAVTVTVPVTGDFTVEGSEESALLQQVNNRFLSTVDEMNAVTASIDENSPELDIKLANAALSKLFIGYKRDAIKYMIGHPRSITSAIVAFQKFNDDLPVFGEPTDAILLKTVQDSLTLVYPKSEFVLALRDQVTALSRALELEGRLGDMGESSFPELVMPDVDGVMRKLSDLEGKVIVLSFWSVGQTDHKMFNVDLADLYRKYHDRGMEVYQVSLDIDKPTWASTVRSQGLPWISVNDGYGIESAAVGTYNVQEIPTMYVFDKSGELVGTDVFDKDALEQLIKKSL